MDRRPAAALVDRQTWTRWGAPRRCGMTSARQSMDRRRVNATGLSNGAMMATGSPERPPGVSRRSPLSPARMSSIAKPATFPGAAHPQRGRSALALQRRRRAAVPDSSTRGYPFRRRADDPEWAATSATRPTRASPLIWTGQARSEGGRSHGDSLPLGAVQGRGRGRIVEVHWHGPRLARRAPGQAGPAASVHQGARGRQPRDVALLQRFAL